MFAGSELKSKCDFFFGFRLLRPTRDDLQHDTRIQFRSEPDQQVRWMRKCCDTLLPALQKSSIFTELKSSLQPRALAPHPIPVPNARRQASDNDADDDDDGTPSNRSIVVLLCLVARQFSFGPSQKLLLKPVEQYGPLGSFVLLDGGLHPPGSSLNPVEPIRL